MSSRMRIFNHWGEFEVMVNPVTTTPRSWVLNGYGRCEFAIPLTDVYCKEKYLEFGNFVHIEHFPDENEDRDVYGKLPTWTGVIMPPSTWKKDAVLVTAYSVEAILAYRAMPYTKIEGTPAQIFKNIIELTHDSFNGNAPFLFKFGQIDDKEKLAYSDELRTNAYDHINKLMKFAHMDWEIKGSIVPESYALELTVNLYKRKALREGLILTAENTEQAEPLLTEQGTIINHVFAYNQAYTAADRTMQECINEESVNRYGPFQTNATYIGVTSDTGMLAELGRSRVAEFGNIKRVFKRVALDYRDTFSYIDTGNIGYVHEPTVGFNADGTLGFRSFVRILSASYNELSNKVDLNVEIEASRVGETIDPDSFFV